jgi:hypothetical protein
MTKRTRARMTIAMVVAAIALGACQQHAESAGSRASGAYGGVEGGVGF